MFQGLIRILTAVQLTRLTMAFGAVSDIWFVILLTRERAEYVYLPASDMNLAAALLAGAIVAIGLFAYGSSLNDVLDVRQESGLSPGHTMDASLSRVKLGQGIVVAAGALTVAMLGGLMLGPQAAVVTLLTSAAILFYNAAGKFVPSVGFTVLGVVHAAHMLIPNYQLEFTLPMWLIMTHSMVIAVIVHRLETKQPPLKKRVILVTVISWLFFSLVLFLAGARHEEGLWPSDAGLVHATYPIVAILSFVAVAWWKTSAVSGHIAAEKLKRYGAMWQAMYGAAWLMTLGLTAQAAWIGAFAVVGFVAMTLIKEATGLSGRPIAYR